MVWSLTSCAGCKWPFPDLDFSSDPSFRLCFKKLGLISPEDYTAVVTKIFWKYMQIMRYLQSTYWLEPAGKLSDNCEEHALKDIQDLTEHMV